MVSEETAKVERVEGMTEQVREVFSFWVKTCCPNARVAPVLSDKRNRKIATAIRLYGVETCLQAIEGVTYSDFHMGANSRGKKYTDIELILRDEAHIEQFAELYFEHLERGSFI
jgi:protein gp37